MDNVHLKQFIRFCLFLIGCALGLLVQSVLKYDDSAGSPKKTESQQFNRDSMPDWIKRECDSDIYYLNKDGIWLYMHKSDHVWREVK